jgi:hypothetical protein
VIRFGTRVRAWVAIAAFVSSFALPLAAADHAVRADDAACNLAADGNGGAETRLRTPAAASTQDHCPLCHFQRAVGGATPSRTTGLSAPSVSSVAVAAASRHAHTLALGTRSSRAPPALL